MALLDTLTPLIEAADTEQAELDAARGTLANLQSELNGARETVNQRQGQVDEASSLVDTERQDAILALRAIGAAVEAQIQTIQGNPSPEPNPVAA